MKRVLWSFFICFLFSGSAFGAMSANDFVQLCRTGSLQQITDAISNGAPVNTYDEYGVTPLMSAAWSNSDPEVIKALINAGADVEAGVPAKGEGVTTPAMAAAWSYTNPKAVHIFIDAGTDVASLTKELGWSPLMMAARLNFGAKEIAAIINAGADVNFMEESGFTPLMMAAIYTTDPEVITALINAGAEVDAQERNASTPLIWAALYNTNPEVITTLLKFGADAKIRDVSGKIAIDYAKENENLINTDAFWKLNDASY